MDLLELEQKRRLALERYGLLDTAPEAIFDGITVAIANICEVPIALVSLVDADRQWFKSSYGLEIRETPRDIAFCGHAIMRPNEMLIVEDAVADPRFQNNPLVTEDPNIRFYAGKPIVTDDGYALGTLCVIDRQPRRILPHQVAALKALGATVSAILDERLRLQKVAIDRDSVEDALNQQADRYQHLYGDAEQILRGLLDQLPSASVVLNPKATIVSFNRAWTHFASLVGWPPAAIGSNYIEQQRRLATVSDDDKTEVQDGIQSVLAGDLDHFRFSPSSAANTWTVEAQPLSRPGGGALVHHFLSKPV